MADITTTLPKMALHRADPAGTDDADGRMMVPSLSAEEQQVLAQVAQDRGETVRVAPGSAGPATVASLISHLAAQGRRVLVTGAQEDPLIKVHDALPAGIRSLSVIVLDSSPSQPEDIERAARAIVEQVGGPRQAAVRRKARATAIRLEELGHEISDLRARLAAAAETDRKVYRLGATRHTPRTLARYLVSTAEQLGYIDDALPPAGGCPLNKKELAALYSLAAKLDPDDCAAGRLALPSPDALPAAAEIVAWRNEIADLAGRLARLDGAVDLPAFEAVGASGTAKLIAFISAAHGQLAPLEAAWLQTIRDEVAGSAAAATAWRDHLQAWRGGIAEIHLGQEPIAGRDVGLPDTGLPTAETVTLLAQLRERLMAGKSVSKVFARDLYRLQQACSVDGAPPSRAEDVGLCLVKARLRRSGHELVRRWNEVIARVGGPALGDEGDHDGRAVERAVNSVAQALEWEQSWSPLHQAIAVAGVRARYRPTAAQLAEIVEAMETAALLFRQRDVEAQLTELGDQLASGAARPDASPLWAALADALAGHDPHAWDGLRCEAERLHELQASVRRLDQLAERLRATAPGWADRIVASRGDQSVAGALKTAHDAWAWRQADTWLSGIGAGEDPADLQHQLDEKCAISEHLTAGLVSAEAWLAVAERVAGTPGAVASAREAVPVWVMTTARAAEAIDPAAAGFDVVIVADDDQEGPAAR